MSYVEVETGRYVKRWAFWDPATWSIPKLYWDAWSQEQRIHAICRQLEKVIKYADYLAVNTDDIAARLKAIEDGELDDVIVAAVEEWFEENAPSIVQDISDLQAALPISEFDAENTVKDAFDTVNDSITAINANGWVTTPRLADEAVTTVKIADGAVTPEKLSEYTVREVYDTVSDLKETTLTSGNVLVLGYHVKGVGGGVYYIDSASTPQHSVLLDNGKYAHLVYDPLNLYASQFGIIGDGTTDETAKLQEMYDLADENATVFLDVDDIYITSTVTIEKSDIKTKGHHEWGSKSDITVKSDVPVAIWSKGNRNSFEGIAINQENSSKYGCAIKFYPDTSIAGVTANDVDAKVIDCGFSNFEQTIITYGRNLFVHACTFTHCNTVVYVDTFASQQDIRGLLVKNCTMHNCREEKSASVNWDSAAAWVVDVNASTPVREIIIQGNNFNAGSYMGFYRGPYGVVIKDNVAIEPGNCASLVYLKDNPAVSKPSSSVIYTGNNIVASYDTPYTSTAFYHEHVFSGNLTRGIVTNNTWSFSGAEHVFESSVGMSQLYVLDNTLNGFNVSTGSATPGNSFFDLYTGVIYFFGNIFRSGGVNRVLHETNPGAGTGGSFYHASDVETINLIEGFTV